MLRPSISPNAVVVSSAKYGAGQGTILLDNLNCTGTESSLAQCSHSGYYNHNCQHNEDVGVVCTTCKYVVTLEFVFTIGQFVFLKKKCTRSFF